MQKYLLNLFVIMFTAASVYFSGCGKKDVTPSGEQSGDTKIEQQTGEQLKTDIKGNELGIKEGLPADYPSDVPQPLNSRVLGSLNTSEGTVVTFESDERPLNIFSKFSEDLEKNGYSKAEGEMMSEDGGMALWNKEKKEVSIMLAWDKEKSISSAVVTYK